MAKRDKNGNLITSPNLLKKLYLDTYKERLKSREMKPELLDLYFLKSELWDLRLEQLEQTKTRPWAVEDLDRVLKDLKRNKTRDPHGLVNEVFKPGVLGEDLKLGMLSLFNCIKQEQNCQNSCNLLILQQYLRKKGPAKI